MAKLSRKKGSTSQIFHVFIQDSTSTVGAGKTGLVYNTAGLTCKYINSTGTLSPSATIETISTLGTYSAPTNNTSIRFKEIDATDPSKGLYELQVHNDWMNVTGGNIIIMLAGATGMAPVILEIDLLTDSNVTHIAGTAQTGRDIGANVLLSPGTGTGQLSLTSGKVTVGTNDDKTAYTLSTSGADAIYDAIVEGTITVKQFNKLILSVLAGKTLGGGSNNVIFRDSLDLVDRITATVDVSGNRTALTFNVTG